MLRTIDCRKTLNPVDKQAFLEVRDRLIGRVNTMSALHERLTDRIAAADRSLQAIDKTPGPSLYQDIRFTAFLFVALRRVANDPLQGPRLLGRTPPRPSFVADFVRLFVVLCSIVGTAALIVPSGVALGAAVGATFAVERCSTVNYCTDLLRGAVDAVSLRPVVI